MAQMDVERDVQQLAELGYRQELSRAWSGFTNFAISFTIISVLAGCFTNFSFAWGGGGPAAIAWGWPILCAFVLLVALSMSELTAAYPTAGGPYWWAAKLGGKGWSWFTGWFNMVGLVGIVAGVGYGAALFLNALLGLYGLKIFGVDFGDSKHVLGVLVIIGILAFVPDNHQSVSFVFTERINNTGFHAGSAGGLFFWLYILPVGFILTMYTQTG